MQGRVQPLPRELLPHPLQGYPEAPTVNVIGGAWEVAEALGINQWLISITYSGGLAMVSVMAVAN